jgi:hypothetical protein
MVNAIDELDLTALGHALWRRKGLVGALTLSPAPAFAAVNLVTPRQCGKARLPIETRDNICGRTPRRP